ncbi:hypothetical protein FocnCong_v010749 [Fusarium oxysporum f. sp. conglutinans]|nr:hypothetical protein FocnCong_v010749 [Fusarium oxysporum f. sp. conglutinans]
MDRRFRESGSKGLGMALSEGVAAVDRLGNFCFTGDPRVLPTKMTTFLHEVFQDLWIPETVAFIARQVRRGLNRGIRSGGRSGVGEHGDVDTGNEESAQAMIALEAWEARDSPFKTSNFEKLSAEVLKFDDRSMMSESKIVLKTRRDFAEEIFVALMEAGRKGHPGVESIAPTHSTWPSILQAAIQHTRGSFATRAQWVSGIAAAIVSASIEWVPGSHHRRLTHQQVVQLVGAAASAKGDQLVLSHYCAAYCCLTDCLEDPLCDLMLMLTLTITASSATPEVRPNTKRRDPALLAANMVTRMLWFLRPEAFPWDKDRDSVLRVSEMTKKIEHKG